ncbi:MAG: hypothetical protein R3Y51_05945 [Rikenellaceae bacterium]
MNLKSLSQAILYFLILIIVFWSKDFFLDAEPYYFIPTTETSFSGYSAISRYIFITIEGMGLFGYLITMFATMINALYMSRIIVRFNTNMPKSFISMIVFLCLVSISFVTKFNFVNHIIIFLLLSSCEKQIFVQLNHRSIKYSFFSAFCLGMAALLAPVYYLFLIVLIVTHLIASSVTFREVSASFLGMLTPFLLFSYFQWLNGNDFLMLYNSTLEFFSESFLEISINLQDYDLYHYIYAFLMLICSVVGIITFIKYNNDNSTKFEYTYYLFLVNIGLGLLLSILFFSAIPVLFPVFVVGFASIISALIVQTERIFFKLSLIIIFVAFSALLNFINN